MSSRQLMALLALSLLVIVGLAALDQKKPWKGLQLEVDAARLAFLEAELEEMERARSATLAELEDEVEAARQAAKPKAREGRELERELFRLERNLSRAQRRLSSATDTAIRRESRIEVESLREMIEQRRQRLLTLSAPLRQSQERFAAAREPLETLRAEIDHLDDWAWLRRLPGLRYLAPALTVRHIRGEAGIERCTTCHLGADPGLAMTAERSAIGVEAFLGAPAGLILGPHPRPELFIAAGGAHDMATIGCVACHGGDPRATGLAAAGHLPASPEIAERWRRDWDWRPGEVGESILPGEMAAAGCATCHGAGSWIPGAPDWQRARRLERRLGCAACHGGEQDRPDISGSPYDLRDLATKTAETQVMDYLADPRSAISGARMPAFWLDRPAAERDLEVSVLTAELWRRSGPREASSAAAVQGYQAASRGGEPALGELLFESLGCGDCHRDGATREGAAGGPAAMARLQRAWLIAFLLQGHRPGLDLKKKDAVALASFLAPSSDAAPGERSAADSIDEAARDRRLLELLEETLPIEASQAMLEALDGAGRTRHLADLLLERYACASCHTIPGWAPSTSGAESSSAGDFVTASQRIEQRRRELAEGRGSEAAEWFHDDRPNLGSYGVSDEESRLLDIRLLGESRAVSRATSPLRAVPEAGLGAGRAVFERHACRACHVIEGEGGDLGPSLDRALGRLRSSWITAVLRSHRETGDEKFRGVRARPWMGAHMPDFDLEAVEIDAVVDYFAARAGLPRAAAESPPGAARERAVGRAVFAVLQCGRCHGVGPRAAAVANEADDGAEGLLPVEMAPDYRLTSKRLRPDWLRAYLLDPRRVDDESTMPPVFPALPGGAYDSSYLIGSFSTPMFQIHRLRLLRYFDGEEELAVYFSDPEKVTEGLATYLESLAPASGTNSPSAGSPSPGQ